MPIRMTDDPEDQGGNDYNEDRGGEGGPGLPGKYSLWAKTGRKTK